MLKFLATAALAALVSVPALAEDIKIGVTPGEHAQIMEKVKEKEEEGMEERLVAMEIWGSLGRGGGGGEEAKEGRRGKENENKKRRKKSLRERNETKPMS